MSEAQAPRFSSSEPTSVSWRGPAGTHQGHSDGLVPWLDDAGAVLTAALPAWELDLTRLDGHLVVDAGEPQVIRTHAQMAQRDGRGGVNRPGESGGSDVSRVSRSRDARVWSCYGLNGT